MATMLRPRQKLQLQSFWNLIQDSDEGVQKELYVLLQHKYADNHQEHSLSEPSFLEMQGILKGDGNGETDRKMIDDYLFEKYGQ